MCRLAFVPPHSHHAELATRFETLELECGGHGNGIAILGSRARVKKGVKMTTATAARRLSKLSVPSLFHSRMTSVGGICDALCHPFHLHGRWGEVILQHNGTVVDWHKYALFLAGQDDTILREPLSDSKVVACMVAEYGLGVFGSLVESGVFMVAYRETGVTSWKVRAYCLSGDLWVAAAKGWKPRYVASSGGSKGLEAMRGTVINLWPRFRIVTGGFTKARKTCHYRKQHNWIPIGGHGAKSIIRYSPLAQPRKQEPKTTHNLTLADEAEEADGLWWNEMNQDEQAK